jgi:hypothetical protein
MFRVLEFVVLNEFCFETTLNLNIFKKVHVFVKFLCIVHLIDYVGMKFKNFENGSLHKRVVTHFGFGRAFYVLDI